MGAGCVKCEKVPPGVRLVIASKNNQLPEAKKAAAVKGVVTDFLDPLTGQTALHVAAACGSQHIVELLFTRRANVDAKDAADETPLHLAMYSGQAPSLDVARRLIEEKANIEARNADRKTPLHIAAKSGVQQGVLLLLERKAVAAAADEDGDQAMHDAARAGHAVVVATLVSQQIDMAAMNGKKRDPLHVASVWGHDVVVETLLKNGAPVSTQDESGDTPLHAAARAGHDAVVRLLIQWRSRAEIPNNERQTPLHHAASKGHVSVASLLLQTTTLVLEQKDAFHNTPAHLAARQGHAAVLAEMRRLRVLTNDQNHELRTALHEAASGGHAAAVMELTGAGLHTEIQDRRGYVALHCAAEACDGHGAVNGLVAARAQLEALNTAGDTPLLVAVTSERISSVDALLRARAHTDMVNRQTGNTPLHIAATIGSWQLTDLLMNFGASTERINSEGKRPFEIAAMKEYGAITRRLNGTILPGDAAQSQLQVTPHAPIQASGTPMTGLPPAVVHQPQASVPATPTKATPVPVPTTLPAVATPVASSATAVASAVPAATATALPALPPVSTPVKTAVATPMPISPASSIPAGGGSASPLMSLLKSNPTAPLSPQGDRAKLKSLLEEPAPVAGQLAPAVPPPVPPPNPGMQNLLGVQGYVTQPAPPSSSSPSAPLPPNPNMQSLLAVQNPAQAPPMAVHQPKPPLAQTFMTKLTQTAAVKLQQSAQELVRLETSTEDIAQKLNQRLLSPQQAHDELTKLEANAAQLECHGVAAVQTGGLTGGQTIARDEQLRQLERIQRLFGRLEELLNALKGMHGFVPLSPTQEPGLGGDGTYIAMEGTDTAASLQFAVQFEQKAIQELEDSIYACMVRLRQKTGGVGAPTRDVSVLQGRPDILTMTIPSLKAELCYLQASRRHLKEAADAYVAELMRSAGVQSGTQTPQLFGFDQDHGLHWYRKWQGQRHGPSSEDQRARTRQGTKRKVAKELGLAKFGDAASASKCLPPNSKATTLFIDQSRDSKIGSAAAGGLNLLGRYDLVCVRVRADIGWNWRMLEQAARTREFWILHAAALNIGETKHAPDFPDFARPTSSSALPSGLDEDRYIVGMGRIFDNIVQVCGLKLDNIGVEHLVIFPFGMGAFLRKLPLVDSQFEDSMKMLGLRRRLAQRLVQSLAHTPTGLRIHVCVSRGSDEAAANADAFIRAFSAADASLRQRVLICPDADSLQICVDLAETSRGVVLLNGANRQLIGNHWFEGRATSAIDENLHRRSWTMAALAYMLNDYREGAASHRTTVTLQENVVQRLGGKAFSVGTA